MSLWNKCHPISLSHSTEDYYVRKIFLFHFRYFVLGSHSYKGLICNLTCTMLNADSIIIYYWFIFWSVPSGLISILNSFNFKSIRNTDRWAKMWAMGSGILRLVTLWEKTNKWTTNCLPVQILQLFFKVWSWIFYNFPNYSSDHVAVKLLNQRTQIWDFAWIAITQDYSIFQKHRRFFPLSFVTFSAITSWFFPLLLSFPPSQSFQSPQQIRLNNYQL